MAGRHSEAVGPSLLLAPTTAVDTAVEATAPRLAAVTEEEAVATALRLEAVTVVAEATRIAVAEAATVAAVAEEAAMPQVVAEAAAAAAVVVTDGTDAWFEPGREGIPGLRR